MYVYVRVQLMGSKLFRLPFLTGTSPVLGVVLLVPLLDVPPSILRVGVDLLWPHPTRERVVTIGHRYEALGIGPGITTCTL